MARSGCVSVGPIVHGASRVFTSYSREATSLDKDARSVRVASVEVLALGAFSLIHCEAKEPLLRALLSAVIQDEARRHAENLRFHGIYADLPFDQMLAAFVAGYARADLWLLSDMGLST